MVAFIATAAEVEDYVSSLTAAAERVVKACLLALAAHWSWLVKDLVLSSSWQLMLRNSQSCGSSSSYLLVRLPAVIRLLIWQGMVAYEVIIGRGM